MARSAGFLPLSAADTEVIGLDFGPNLNGSAITGAPVVAGVNCTATYVAHTAAGVVSCRVTGGSYAGTVTATVALADGRTVSRSVGVRFL